MMSPVTLSDAYRMFLDDPSKGRSEKTLLAYRTASEIVLSFLGAEKRLTALTRNDCRELLHALQRLPGNAKKKWPNLSAPEAVDRASELGLAGMSIANANGLMNKFNSVLNWAVNEELLPRNPSRGLRLPDPVAPKHKRRSFSPDQLKLIFNSPLYLGCMNDQNGYATPGPALPRRARFWVPLIGLFSGLRLNEICQMDVADITEVEGILCFHVLASDAVSGKRLKTAASERIVPVHPTLLRIGFSAYLRDREREESLKLFPELPIRYGLYSHLFSRWFGRFLRSCGAAAERTCFHSFRHNFRDALRLAKVDRELAHALGGWTSNASVADRYGSGFDVPRLYAAILSVAYDRLDLAHLSRTKDSSRNCKESHAFHNMLATD